MSNLYADKIFSEHPIALWSMDDDVSYISFIDESYRDYSSWTVSNGVVSSQDLESIPFENSNVSSFSLDISSTNTVKPFSIIGPETISFDSLNSNYNVFTIGAYFYINDPEYATEDYISSISSYEIGYRYYDSVAEEYVENTKIIAISKSNFWIFGSASFEIPNYDGNFSLVLKVNYSDHGQDAPIVSINGLSLGQLCEEFNATSLGAVASQISPALVGMDDFSYDSVYGINADQYGLSENSGYYIVGNGNIQTCSSSSIPVTFGEASAISVFPGALSPAVIFPGKGFLTNNKRYSDYTIEFWLRISEPSNTKYKIFGQISSDNGIYINGHVVEVILGKYSMSYFIEQITKPMLVDWTVSENRMILLINGSSVASTEIDISNVSLTSFNYNDWLAFYQNQYIEYAIDSFAIYPYKVSTVLAKRRFAYGQAVELPEISNSYYSGTVSVFDGTSVKYSNSYVYPKIGKWEQGILENLSISQTSIGPAIYSLPEIVFDNNSASTSDKTMDAWLQLLYNNNVDDGLTRYFDFQDYVKYLWLENVNILQKETKAFYCIFKINEYVDREEVLLWLHNPISKQYFNVIVYSDKIIYRFFDGTSETEVFRDYVADGRSLMLGINFDSISDNFSESVRSFFGNKNQIEVYIGGYKGQDAWSFSGGIYRIGISDDFNFAKIKDTFPSISPVDSIEITLDAGGQYFGNDELTWSDIADGGVVLSFDNSIVESLLSHYATYTVFANYGIAATSLEVATHSYWEDRIPLSYFGKYVSDEFGKSKYSLDSLQFDMSNSVRYLDNEQYDISKNIIKSYITFQDIYSELGNRYSYYQNSVELDSNRLISPEDEWINSKYEISNGTIVYPPKGVDFNDLYLVTHIEFYSNGSSDNPLAISNLKYSGQAASANGSNPINTKFGKQVYPFVKYGSYYNYSARNPIRISKQPEPYLYIGNDFGLEIVSDSSINDVRGISIPINEGKSSEFQVGNIQVMLNVNLDSAGNAPIEIFEIKSTNHHWKFYIEKTVYSSKRVKIYAVDYNTGLVNRNIAFYINGRIVLEPVVNLKTWIILGIDFIDILDFSQVAGAWRVTGPLKINYPTYYNYVSKDNSYDTYSGLPNMQNGGLLLDTRAKTLVNSKTVFKKYTGTDMISDQASTGSLMVNNYKYTSYNNIGFTSFVAKPV